MHVEDNDLKALIDCVAMRLDDEMDTLGEDLDVRRVLDDRDDVRTIWSLTDLLENLRQEQRSRRKGGSGRQFAGISNVPAPADPRLEMFEKLVAEHEEDRRALRAELGAVQATLGDLLAQSNDHREQLNALRPDAVKCWTRVNELERKLDSLKARDPDVLLWGRIKAFERKMEKWAREVGEVLEARTVNAELSAEALLRLTRVTEELHRNLQALELQSDDRWVKVQQGDNLLGVRLKDLEMLLENHVGEGEVRH